MIYINKLIPVLMTCTMVSLTSGCDKSGSGQTGNAFRGNYPAQVALDSMGDAFQDSATDLSVTQHVNSGESPDKAVVTIEESGLLDDSIAAEKTFFTMSYREDKWQIINRVKTQRCWPERGHQDFSEQPCH